MANHKGRNIYLLQAGLAGFLQGLGNSATFPFSFIVNKQASPNHKRQRLQKDELEAEVCCGFVGKSRE